MTKVIDLSARRAQGKSKGNTKRANAVPRIDRETYELWTLSQDIDALVTKAVAEKGLALEEVAAILAHRLGTLAVASKDPEKLVGFCASLLERLAGGSDPEGDEGGKPPTRAV